MRISSWTAFYGSVIAFAATPVLSTQQHNEHHEHTRRAVTTTPMVFAHYMISYQPPNLDYSNDIKLAKAAGIDAFAVNYGGWGNAFASFSQYLDIFYKTAEDLDFKLFICFDTTSVTDKNMVTNLTNFYADSKAQATDADGKIFLSSFQLGAPPWNWQTDIIDHIDHSVTLIPGTLSEDGPYTAGSNEGFGPFTWVHPACDGTEEQAVDTSFADERNSNGAPWMAGVAPWFFKRMSETDGNWLHAQDSEMWIDRWMHLLKVKPNYIEIVTWNDFGESSYIGPMDSTPEAVLMEANTIGYYGNLDHTAFLKMTSMFIKAFKAGDEDVTVDASEEEVFMFYRLQPMKSMGSNPIYPDNAWPLPENASSISDNVYVIPFLATPATVYLNSGGKAWQMEAPVGVSKGIMPFSLGNQTLTASRAINGQTLNKEGPAIVAQMERYQGNVVAI